jgi:DNA-binding transcriptional regulator/RsmH inhibitor MraZ
LKIFEARIDPKGRIYIPANIRKLDFFNQKKYRLLPIVRSSTKQIERGLLLIKEADEFEANYFWGIYDNENRYTIEYDAHGRLATTENIMQDLELHNFKHKLIYFVESCFGWELWAKHRLKRLMRSFRAYGGMVAKHNPAEFKAGCWVSASLSEKYMFSKEAGKEPLYKAIRKPLRDRDGRFFFILEKMNDTRLLFFDNLSQAKKEIGMFIEFKGSDLAFPSIDTESRLCPSGLVKMSFWKKHNVLRIAFQRTRNLTNIEKSKQIATLYQDISMNMAKRFMEAGSFKPSPFFIDDSEVWLTFILLDGDILSLGKKSKGTFALSQKKVNVFFDKDSRANIVKDFF